MKFALTTFDIGLQLRAIRHQKGLTLKDVENSSRGEWKAVVLGSYERNDRSLSLRKAIALAEFYEVPLEHLLGISERKESSRTSLILDLRTLARMRSQSNFFEQVSNFAHIICAKRRDWNGEVLSLRQEDLLPLALINNCSEIELREKLNAAGLLLRASS
ncbi:MAG: helix-turn-helix transcriptional regulator [Actinomycetes bacterium]